MSAHIQTVSRRSLGVTLIELMVGITLGMIVAVALLLLFANASSNGKELQRSSEQIENGRYAVELLRDDLQMAGYFGETSVTGAAYSTPDPCLTVPTGFIAAPLTYPTPVRGYGTSEALDCLTSRYRLAGTQALVVRRLETTTATKDSLASANKQYFVQYSFCEEDTSGIPPAPPLVFDKAKDQFTLRNKACKDPNPLRAYVSRIYFVASCSRCGAGGDSYPTLKRLELVGDELVETALVEGVESLRLEYGFDTDNNGSVDEYRSALAATGEASKWENVVALKLHFLVRSLDKASGSLATEQTFNFGGLGTVGTAADGYLRRAYSTTIRLINPSGAREMP